MREFCIGLDLCDAYSQMSYYDEEKDEPESISQINNPDTYLLPNIVFYGEESGQF